MKKAAAEQFTKKEQEAIRNALYHGAIRKVEKYLHAGWNPREALCGGNPLAMVESPQLAKLLLDAGADPDAGFARNAPIFLFCANGPREMVDVLIDAGANVNVRYSKRDNDDVVLGATPLMLAVSCNKIEIAKLLLQAGADVNIEDRHGHNALFYACRWDRTALATELLRRGSKLTDDVLCGPVKHANVKLLKALIAKNANLNCVFRKNVEGAQMWPKGETVLAYAIHMISHVEFELGGRDVVVNYPAKIAELLIKAGADVNQPSNWWRVTRIGDKYRGDIQPTPPIRIAGSRGLEGMMKLLWKAGAKGTLQEAMADCSLERAAYRNSPAIAKLLIKAGADVNAAGEETGKRPIELAREKGHTAILEILKKAGAKE